MTIEFTCSGCKASLRLPDEMGGLRGQCVQCGAVLDIPSATEHYWPPGAKPVTAARAALRIPPVPPPPPSYRPSQDSDQSSARPAALRDTTSISVAQTTTIPIPPLAAASQAGNPHGGAAGKSSARLRPLVIPDRQDSHGIPDRHDSNGAAHARHSHVRSSLCDLLARTWAIFTTNWRLLVGLGLLECFGAGLVTFAVVFFLHALSPLTQALIIQAVLVWLMIGAVGLTLRIARGRRPSLATLLDGIPFYLSGLTTWAICFVPLALVALLCSRWDVLPIVTANVFLWVGTIVGFMIWIPSLLVLVDQEVNPIKALQLALEYTARNAAQSLGLTAISLGILVAAAIPAGLGLPVALPFVLVSCSVAYLRDRATRR